jgi:Neuraminidase (sialidase)
MIPCPSWRAVALTAAFCATFSAASAAAQVEFNPEYEKDKSRVSYATGIVVVRGQTQVIVSGWESVCPTGIVFKYNNGDIQVHDRRSRDGGKTWTKGEHVVEASTFQFPEPDGEVIMFRSYDAPAYADYNGRATTAAGRPESRIHETAEKGVYDARFFRSKDHGVTRVEEIAKLYLPKEFTAKQGYIFRKIIRTADGSLLTSMAFSFARSRKLIALRSTDRGKTWHYHSTIAFDLANRGVSNEGFSETSLLAMPDGKILTFMRSGASYTASLGSIDDKDSDAEPPFGYRKQTPLYSSVSADGGKTWSNADPVAPFGVWPDSVLLKNGIISVTYGRPGNWIQFSRDEGKTWVPVLQFYNDLYPPDCGNYFTCVEVAPNILLVAYARTDPNDRWRSDIVGTYFQVKRTK